MEGLDDVKRLIARAEEGSQVSPLIRDEIDASKRICKELSVLDVVSARMPVRLLRDGCIGDLCWYTRLYKWSCEG
jgi:hypothetical protein